MKKKEMQKMKIILSSPSKKMARQTILLKTENYVGKFKWQGLEIDIKSRFSNIFGADA